MAKNVKTAAAKGRETKLSKKTNDELIQIILRKDKTEKNLSSQVVNLKAEINQLTTRVNNFDKDQEGNLKAIEDWRTKYEAKCDSYNSLNDFNTVKIRDLNQTIKYKEAEQAILKKRLEDTSHMLSLTIGAAAVILILSCIAVYVLW